MATAKRNDPKPVTPPPPTYTLELSEDEAGALRGLIYFCIAGTSPARSALQSVSHALGHAGVIAQRRGFTGYVEAIDTP